MKRTNEFADYTVELCSTLGRVAWRRMFGGYGLYCDGTMFALIADDVLYLKVDDANRGEFERTGATPFAYDAGGKRTVMSYYRAPADAMESRELAAPWARSAYAAALRTRSSKTAAGRRPSRHPAQPARRGRKK
jgi:DNA transformation protein